MTISLQANAAGNAGQINIGATPVVNLPVASGIPFCKNKLFNGEVTRINQRGFDGNWTPKGTWAGGNTIAQQELCYGYDMWAKASATDMVQLIEAGNFRPSTVHTISGLNMTTRQETSPASGHWNIVVPQTARNVQVEEGLVATPFEIRPISFELAQCQRYYEKSYELGTAPGTASNFAGTATTRRSTSAETVTSFSIRFSVNKRATPKITWYSPMGAINSIRNTSASVDLTVTGSGTASIPSETSPGVPTHATETMAGALMAAHWTASAVI